jgi:CheY-like chemotaxis protein
MGTLLNILILGDSAPDAEQEVALLEEAAYTCRWERVQTRDEFIARLQNDYDLILADDQLSQLNGLMDISASTKDRHSLYYRFSNLRRRSRD